MPLKLVQRGKSSNWYIRGSIRNIVVDESTGLSDRKAAEEVLAVRAAEILQRSIHGDRAVRTFADAALSYLQAGGEGVHLKPILKHFGPKKLLSAIDQSAIDDCARKLKPRGAPGTLNRHVYTPIAAVLHHAARKRWCEKPVIARPTEPAGRVRWLTYEEADRLIEAASPHLRPLVIFLLCTGARLSEALYLDWRQVDLPRGHVALLNVEAGGVGTKNGESRGVPLHPRAVAALANLPHRKGAVFRCPVKGRKARNPTAEERAYGPPYKRRSGGGGQLRSAWASMLKRAKISDFTPHDCRHTWATWHYAANKDVASLMALGGWKSLAMVMRYTHINTAHLAPSINRIWEIRGDLPKGDSPNPLPLQA